MRYCKSIFNRTRLTSHSNRPAGPSLGLLGKPRARLAPVRLNVMNKKIKNISLVIALTLLGHWNYCFAKEPEKPLLTFSSTYLEKTSKLYIMKEVFEGKAKCNLEVLESKKLAVEYVGNAFSELNWKLQSIQVLFSENSEEACIHLVAFVNRTNNRSSYLKVGIGMNGELIKPVIESRTNLKHK